MLASLSILLRLLLLSCVPVSAAGGTKDVEGAERWAGSDPDEVEVFTGNCLTAGTCGRGGSGTDGKVPIGGSAAGTEREANNGTGKGCVLMYDGAAGTVAAESLLGTGAAGNVAAGSLLVTGAAGNVADDSLFVKGAAGTKAADSLLATGAAALDIVAVADSPVGPGWELMFSTGVTPPFDADTSPLFLAAMYSWLAGEVW